MGGSVDGGANGLLKNSFSGLRRARPNTFARTLEQNRPLPEGERAAAAAVRLQFRLGTVMLEVDEHFALDAIRRARRVGA